MHRFHKPNTSSKAGMSENYVVENVITPLKMLEAKTVVAKAFAQGASVIIEDILSQVEAACPSINSEETNSLAKPNP